MPHIMPASELQRNIGSVYETCARTREPVYVTRNGEAVLVVMDADAFDERMELQQLLYDREMRMNAAILRGHHYAERGVSYSLEEVRAERGRRHA